MMDICSKITSGLWKLPKKITERSEKITMYILFDLFYILTQELGGRYESEGATGPHTRDEINLPLGSFRNVLPRNEVRSAPHRIIL
jgi:hypothetical protein